MKREEGPIHVAKRCLVPGGHTLSADRLVALQSLRQVALLQGLSEEVLADVVQAGSFKRYRARQELFARDDVDRDCFVVLAGRLRAVAWSPSGREVSFRDVEAGQTIGEMSAIDGRPRSASVVALVDSLVLRLTPETLNGLMRRHWPVCERMLQHLAASARDMTARVYELSALGVQQRLCAELLRLTIADSSSGDRALIKPTPSHSEMAARIGCTRPQVTRELAELERLGLIERGDSRLTVADLQRLAEHVERPFSSA